MKSHGKADSTDKTYLAWCNMRGRCDNPNHVSAHIYHAKGICYDPSWNDYEVFLHDMGPSPANTWLDRKDGNLGYSKENCRWASDWEHGQNKCNMTLNAALVAQIKRELAVPQPHGTRRRQLELLGKAYGVSWTTIRHIHQGKTWCNIEAAE